MLYFHLFMLSAGNITDSSYWMTYPANLSLNQINYPGQAWNALTIVAYTTKATQEDPEYQPVAAEGSLSSFTSTSKMYESVWPLKPDVVFVGGNAVSNGTFADCFDCINLSSPPPRSEKYQNRILMKLLRI
ncbi:S8 family serine peptidase [Enterobacter hormaechei subsp. steigerwaltii]|uniref:S8 family serine peptidase n=1 Tax=Enterobacter hormaechei TaxID=158836 RepID=UPI003F42CD23